MRFQSWPYPRCRGTHVRHGEGIRRRGWSPTPGGDFPLGTRGVMITVTRAVCDRSDRGGANDRAGQEGLMASHPMGPGSAVAPSEWHSSANVYTRGQMIACVRARLIALVLLGILALIVLY